MGWLSWVLVPLLGGIIGFLTNWVAVQMLFRPRQPVLGFQGLIPRRQPDLAKSVSKVIADELLNSEELLKPLETMDLRNEFDGLVGTALERKAEDLRKMPLLGSFITEERLANIRALVVEELVAAQPKIVRRLQERLGDSIDIAGLAEAKLASFELDRLERVVWRVASKEFRAIEVWGLVLGVIIGFAQAGLMTLLQHLGA